MTIEIDKLTKLEIALMKYSTKDVLITWWMNPSYDLFVREMNLDFNNIKENQKLMRYHLNKLVKKGIFESKSGGTGFCGRTDFGGTYHKSWMLTQIGEDILYTIELQNKRYTENTGNTKK